ncbi:multimerin-2 [Choloepus didactylus]|uniref:multimerin-2 n=1 Tax=Choloepus didactylus TaxID=27675 RepID=UPI00189D7A06|nr:multimerin-2 [Choloepus didactylus]
MILTLLLGLGGPLGWGLLGVWAQSPGARLPDPHIPGGPEEWRAETEDPGRNPAGRNWCPYQKSRLVTFIATCKTERFLVHSQQLCPQGTLDCQKVKVLYRLAHQPLYQVKQKVLVSVAWRCCPGYTGPNCQHYDPTVTPEPAGPGTSHEEPGEGLAGFESGPLAVEMSRAKVQQEGQVRDLQNDIHQAADSLPGLWKALASNLTAAAAEANHTELGLPGTSLEQVLLPHLDAFLQVHFSPIWRSFNESLHSLSQAVRNLSLDMEANRQAVEKVQESTVARADFQELGAKFEGKAQENAQRVGQLRQDMDERLHAQHLLLQSSLSEIQTHVDTKLKRLHKALELPGANDSLLVAVAAAGAAARPEPESLQARLGQLQRNLSALHVAAGHREEELQGALQDIRATLAQHGEEIKELYSESDETFEQISKVERLVEELQVNHTALRELRVILMEKSLIMEENKEEVERQLLELNVTLQHLQAAHADLIKYVKDCNCQKLYFDLDVIRAGQKNTTRVLEETQVTLDERRQLDGPSLQALRSALETLAESMEALRAEGVEARADLSRLRSQLQALLREVTALKAAEGLVRRDVGQLHSSFSALLEDALRHEAVLAALFGEEALEEMAEEAPGPLPLRYEQIREALRDAASGLQEQALAWDALAARVGALEQAAGKPARSPEHWEPGREAPGKEGHAPDLGLPDLEGLKAELQRLDAEVQRVGPCCEVPWAAALNNSLQGLRGAASTTERALERHERLFHSLFGNFQGLVAANVSLDLGKLQAMLSRRGKKQQNAPETTQKRDRKQMEPWTDSGIKGSPVAFYASFAAGTAALQMVKFNTTYTNVGSSYFPQHGYFRAPERGVYFFAVSIEFGPGPGTGQLVFGGHHRTPVHASEEQRGGGTATTFAVVELQKGERVWFELTQGSVRKRSTLGTAFGGFLIFKT